MANQPQIRILAVDDHALLRKGIRMLISTECDMRLAAEETAQTRCPRGLGGNVLNNTTSKGMPGESSRSILQMIPVKT